MIFAKDIHKRIRTDFQKEEEVEDVETKLKRTVDIGLNVGEGQFVRSVIFLANKNKDRLEQILNEFDDPRDVVFEAEEKSGRLDHWFAIPFDEIEQLNGKRYSGEVFRTCLDQIGSSLAKIILMNISWKKATEDSANFS